MSLLFLLNEVLRLASIAFIFLILFKWAKNPSSKNNISLLKKGIGAALVSIITVLIKMAFAHEAGISMEKLSIYVPITVALAAIFGGVCMYRLQKIKN